MGHELACDLLMNGHGRIALNIDHHDGLDATRRRGKTQQACAIAEQFGAARMSIANPGTCLKRLFCGGGRGYNPSFSPERVAQRIIEESQVMATFSYRERMIQMMAVGLFIGLFVMLRKMPGQT